MGKVGLWRAGRSREAEAGVGLRASGRKGILFGFFFGVWLVFLVRKVFLCCTWEFVVFCRCLRGFLYFSFEGTF